MAEPSKNLKGVPQPPLWVEYADPSGGLNTKRDVHALDRNMLAVSINGWPAYDNVVAKRPASAYYINATNGATGLGGAGTTIVFDHTGFPAGEFDHLDWGWKNHYWEPLQKFLA